MFINIEEVISDIQVDLGQSTPNMTAIIKRWCYECVRELGVGYMQLKTKVYSDISTTVLKPSDFVAAAHVYLATDDGKCVEPKRVNLPCYGKTPWNFGKYGYSFSGLSSNNWSVSETNSSFSISTDAVDNFSKLILVYYTVPIDDQGNPLIPGFSKQACWAYCMWKNASRNRTKYQSPSSDSRGNPVPLSEVQNWRNEYYLQLSKARGEMNSPQYQELFEVGESIMFGVTNEYPSLLHRYQSSI